MLPNFIVVGAPKAGTTSLCHYFSEHPQVFMSEPKEVNFFSKEEIQGQGLYYNDFKAENFSEYENLFINVTDEKAIGEGSVSYLFYPKTPHKIKDALPDVKIIILLREPVGRGFSHYLMDYRLGLVDIPFDEIVYKKNIHKNIALYYQQYIDLGMYYQQVKRYKELFNQNQVRIYLQEDLRNNMSVVIKDLYNFIGVDDSFSPNFNIKHNVFSMPNNKLIHKLYASQIIRKTVSTIFPNTTKETIKNIFFKKTAKPTLDKNTFNHLVSLYKSDIKQLENLIGRNLEHWYKRHSNA